MTKKRKSSPWKNKKKRNINKNSFNNCIGCGRRIMSTTSVIQKIGTDLLISNKRKISLIRPWMISRMHRKSEYSLEKDILFCDKIML
jgi:ribosomal protein S26